MLTQAELAQLAGLRTATVADLEATKQKARPSTIRKLAKALGIRPEQLLEPPRHGANGD